MTIIPNTEIATTLSGNYAYGNAEISAVPIDVTMTSINVTFEGVLYENVPVVYWSGSEVLTVGEWDDDLSEPSFSTYPFYIILSAYEGMCDYVTLNTADAGIYSFEISAGQQRWILKDKTANNVYDRFHRMIIGDQNQIEGGNGGFETCIMTFDETSSIYVENKVQGKMMLFENEPFDKYETCVDISIARGDFGFGIYYADEIVSELEIINKQIVTFSNNNGYLAVKSVSVTGNAEVVSTDNSYFWTIKIDGDFTIKVDLHN